MRRVIEKHKQFAPLILGLFIMVFAIMLLDSLAAPESAEEGPLRLNGELQEMWAGLLPKVEEVKKTRYIEVVDACGPYYGGECVNVRPTPSTEKPAIAKLRNGVVLKVEGEYEGEGRKWYKIAFDEWLRYPERVNTEWYVAADLVHLIETEVPQELGAEVPTTNKRIIVDRSEQKLYAYEGQELYMEESISTGLELTPTPRGQFKVFRKTPSRYMQGPIPGITEKEYDVPGVPWNMYFTNEGAVIHGAYWHDHFGQQWSNGCVNLPPQKAKELYHWADLGTPILVRD